MSLPGKISGRLVMMKTMTMTIDRFVVFRERDEDYKRDDEYYEGHSTKIHLMPYGWPLREVTDTIWLKGAMPA